MTMGHFWLGQLMSFFYDPVGDRLILFSGATDLGKTALADRSGKPLRAAPGLRYTSCSNRDSPRHNS
jgi:hypothetical protein